MDIKAIFPIFKNNPWIVILDSWATAQKPQSVIDEERCFNEKYYWSVWRWNCFVSLWATQKYDEAKEKVANFIWVSHENIAFVAWATEWLNIIASWMKSNLKAWDEVLISILEHNSNAIVWTRLQDEIWIKLKFITLNENQEISLEDIKSSITNKTKVIALTHVSNVSGQILPIKEVWEIAKEKWIYFFVDWCQSAAHMKIDLRKIYLSWFVFSAHKLWWPTWVWLLYLNDNIIDKIKPINIWWWVVLKVSEEKFKLIEWMQKFEAWTQNLSWVIAFAKACEFMEEVGYNLLLENNKKLTSYALKKLSRIKSLKIIWHRDQKNKTAIISFYFKQIHSHDVSQILSDHNICVRSWFHCSDLVHKSLWISWSTRVSFWVYNDIKDVDKLILALEEVVKIFG